MRFLAIAAICIIYCTYVVHGDGWDCRGTALATFDFGTSSGCNCQTYTDCNGDTRICGKDCNNDADCGMAWKCTSHGSSSGNDHKHCEPESTCGACSGMWCLNPTMMSCPCMTNVVFQQNCPAGKK